MNQIAQSIKNRLSLRPPQTVSLEILNVLTDKLKLVSPPINSGVVNDNFLREELEIVHSYYPICTDFERKFPSLTFALATGVGKTRLMGAFITYLYLKKGIKNYFVVAPNLTIYEKLKREFSELNDPKYVFKGIGEFVHNPPIIITGDNYNKHQQEGLFEEIRINIFNISKINAETKGGKEPRIKRLSEYLGESYFNHLANLHDLVLIMDESHHYRADRGMQVINELNPILGLELTATPQVQKGTAAIKFKNVVYEYSLAKAIKDGFVKQPAVATRKDFNPSSFSEEEMDRIKLEDGIKIHEDTKIALDIYARNTKKDTVKPFVLVVARDTSHAQKLEGLIRSGGFFGGYYADKVITVHSNQSGEEKEEVIEKLLSVESYDNKVEVVIHVYMLKEGWDVTNLYTIVPLNAAGSKTLIEQTIGRGLRLPYGQITGDRKVDTLTIVAHDKFQSIVDEANKPDSIIKIENIIDIDSLTDLKPKEIIQSDVTVTETSTNILTQSISLPSGQKDTDKILGELSHTLAKEFSAAGTKISSINGLKTQEIKKIVLDNVKRRIESTPQQQLFSQQIVEGISKSYNKLVDDFKDKTIEIPRIVIQQSDLITWGFHDFDLDLKGLNLQPNDQQIIILSLTSGNIEYIDANKRKIVVDSIENLLVSELMNYPVIDYDSQSELLFRLAHQVIVRLQSYLDENGVLNVIQYQKREISRFIYSQLMEHYYENQPEFTKPIVYPFEEIKSHNYEKFTSDNIAFFRDSIEPVNSIPSIVFHGYTKACHKFYKYKSKTEKDFSIILEQDDGVIKWLKPAQDQFWLYWNHYSQRYTPDFVVETKDTIYMVETKMQKDIEDKDVAEKTKIALEFCHYATEYTKNHKGKGWKYLLIPHNAVQLNMGFQHFINSYEVK